MKIKRLFYAFFLLFITLLVDIFLVIKQKILGFELVPGSSKK
jgi:hypothetical protein